MWADCPQAVPSPTYNNKRGISNGRAKVKGNKAVNVVLGELRKYRVNYVRVRMRVGMRVCVRVYVGASGYMRVRVRVRVRVYMCK